MVPSFTDLIYLRLHSKIGDETRILARFKLQTIGRPQKRQDDFQDNSITKKKRGDLWMVDFRRG
jgi:hypothetical protein